MVTKKCVICQAPFDVKDKSICCGDGCKKKYTKEWQAEYRKNNKSKYKEYRKINKDKIQKYMKKYDKTNKDKKATYLKKYHKDNNNIKRRGVVRKKLYHNSIQNKLVDNLRSRIYKSLKRDNITKRNPSTKLLGIDIESYKKYLESKFDENMNWDNHGQYWEIDHIQPLNTFDLTIKENQLKAFNYKNTRPLEKSLNRSRPNDGSDVEVIGCVV